MRWLSSFWSGWKWVRRARVAAVQHNQSKAELGDPAAQYDLGERHHDGLGVGRDYTLALNWFMRAAAQGHAKAQLNAGLMLFLGRGSVPDRAEAVKWLVLAVEGGEPKAHAALERISRRLEVEVVREGRQRAADYRATRTKA
jgi:uncharacterized protein